MSTATDMIQMIEQNAAASSFVGAFGGLAIALLGAGLAAVLSGLGGAPGARCFTPYAFCCFCMAPPDLRRCLAKSTTRTTEKKTASAVFTIA